MPSFEYNLDYQIKEQNKKHLNALNKTSNVLTVIILEKKKLSFID